MKKTYRFLALQLLVVSSLLLSSCLSGSDSSSITYYDDAAITSFSLSNVKQLTTTTDSEGNTTETYTTLDVSSYKFAIDQAQHLIYNVDSLPVGVDPTRIVCTATAKNGGYLFVKPLEQESEDQFQYYSSSDSLDFSTPRTFRVYAMTGQNYVEYSVKINIHKEEADTFVWRPLITENNELRALSHLRAITLGNQLFAFGVNGTETQVFATDITDGSTWTQVTPNIIKPLSAAAPYNIVKFNDALYLYDQGTLYISSDGLNWESIAQPSLSKLLGGSTSRLYAINQNNQICVSADNGANWTVEDMDADGSLLPTQDFSFVSTPLRSYTSSNQLLIIGNRNITGEDAAQILGKVEQTDNNAEQQTWAYYHLQGESRNLPPHLENLQVISYDGALLAFGGTPMNASTLSQFAGFYKSEDAGITWPLDETIGLPEGFSTNADNFAFTVDDNQFIWLICGGSGQVWRGRINRLGWISTEQYVTQ